MSTRRVYDQVLDHYRACQSDPALLSDTWAHTLRQKGRIFEEAVLERMMELGNPANSWIDDFNYLVDGSILDLKNPITTRLLKLGEPEFGSPRRDCRVEGAWYSSNYVHHVHYATRIIESIQARSIERPRILEVGGGLAGVATLLRLYYGNRCTYFVADLPEGLILQEWYLRNVFSDSPWAFKPSPEPCAFVEDGINFINAFVLASQPLPIDVAINIDSMQEMNREAIQAYLRFFEANISKHGVLFLQNHYGQASDSMTEPSDYPLDDRWTVALAEPAPQIECCSGSEQLRLVLHRTAERVNRAARTLALRTLWNGYMTGHFASAPENVAEILRLAQGRPPEEGAGPFKRDLLRQSPPFSAEDLDALENTLYLPHRSYADRVARGPAEGSSSRTSRIDALWRVQGSYLDALAHVAPDRLQSVPKTLEQAGDVSNTPFYAAFYAGLLGVTGHPEAMEGLLEQAARRTENPFWTVRFAALLNRFHKESSANRLLSTLPDGKSLDFFVALKCGELRNDPNAVASLDPGNDPARRLSRARTAARLGLMDIAVTEARRAAAAGSPSAVLLGLLKADPAKRLHARIADLLPPPPPEQTEESPIVHGFLLLELGRRDEALKLLEPQVQRFWEDYFRLGQMGRFFCSAGIPALADRCLSRSIELRPGAFLHYDFVGNAYFACGRYDKASDAFQSALSFKPTIRHIMGKRLYSLLPADARESGRFGRADDLRLVFQREQDFYHDLAPSSK